MPAGQVVPKGETLPIAGDLRGFPSGTVRQPGVESGAAWVLVPGFLALCALAFGVTGIWQAAGVVVSVPAVAAAPFVV